MKKKIIILSIFLVIIIGFTVYMNVRENGKHITKTDEITMVIKEGTITKTDLDLIIINDSDEDYTYGEEFFIEKKKYGNWRKLKTIESEIWWNSIGYQVEAHDKVEKVVSWKGIYKELKPGKYRLIKQVSRNNTGHIYIAVEFEIKKDIK